MVSLPTDQAGFEHTDFLACHATLPAKYLWTLVPLLSGRCVKDYANNGAGSGPSSLHTNADTSLTLW